MARLLANKGAGKGGRKRGEAYKLSQQITAKAIAEGISPLEAMLAIMREAYDEMQEYSTKLKEAKKKQATKSIKSARSLLNEARDRVMTSAAHAAPYVHPRLQAIEQQHSFDKPPPGILIQFTDDADPVHSSELDTNTPSA